ncbi:thiol-disulfide oxidoreductase DCC family protein [Nitrincola alkalisediminis]|uniref:thiol-disulfide oxidoreductase DCC family protein n=1 Tax=Nitrincola alkalisediminis TaxID=1366656 RepID=UPI00187392F9|nr:DUF393 domain-containing protein [Nitrincola alkalisediminis]
MTDELPRLFYDGKCPLCEKEICYLNPKLLGKIALIDISEAGFEGWGGVSKQAMMKKIHVWTGQNFLIGLDATLYYWRLAGLSLPAKLLSLPLVYSIANAGYNIWAHWRYRRL